MAMFGPHSHRVDVAHTALIDALVRYHDTGDYDRDFEAVGRRALACVEGLRRTKGRRAVVFDIDETSLRNDWPRLIDPELGYDPQAWTDWIAAAKAKALAPTLAVYRAARAKGCAVFFITGRTGPQKVATVKNLKRAGYTEFAEVITEPMADADGDSPAFAEAAAYKSAARWSIVERGYDIVLSLGDQLSDLSGGYARQTFKLPNPFYTVI